MLRKWWLTYQLTRRLKQCSLSAIQVYYQHILTKLNQPISELELLAIDLEMTGLSPQKDQIVSIGIIPIINLQIIPQKAQYKLLKITGSVGQSAVIHGVLDNQLDDALTQEAALTWLLEACHNKVLIAHHAQLDMQFIQQALTKEGINIPCLPAIDTLAIEKTRLLRKQDVLKTGSLRLDACRQRYNLPIYHAHNALTDALACSELFLAQLGKMSGQDKLTLSQLLKLP